MRPHLSDSAKHVSSKNDECSEYGTGNSCTAVLELRAGRRFAYVNVFCCAWEMTDAMVGDWTVPAGGVYLRTQARVR
jgi:hypothetical protein